MNLETLQPFESGERAIENGRKGGIKSGESRRMKKTFKEMAKTILDYEVPEKEKRELLSRYKGLEEEDTTYRALVFSKQLEKALRGNINSAKFVLDVTGEKPKIKEEPITNQTIIHVSLIDDEEEKPLTIEGEISNDE